MKEIAQNLKKVMERSGVFEAEEGFYYSGYVNNLFVCESFFDAIALYHMDETELSVTNLKILLGTQWPNGHIPRHWCAMEPVKTVGEGVKQGFKGETQAMPGVHWGSMQEVEEHAQPYLAQMALMLTRMRGGNIEWLRGGIYARLKRYLDVWLESWDKDRNGLCEWSSAPHAMADNQFDRCGVWRGRFCEGADLNSLLCLEFQAMEIIANALGLEGDAGVYGALAARTLGLIRTVLWDDRDGFFYDRDVRTGLPIKVKAVQAFYTLWAGTATQDQARRLVKEHLFNPEEFWTNWPIPSYAINEPGFTRQHVPPPFIDVATALPLGHCNWRGGVWPHANYMVVHGLRRYGFEKEAGELAEKTYALGAADPDVYEWYDPISGDTCGSCPIAAGPQLLMRYVKLEGEKGFAPFAIGRPDEAFLRVDPENTLGTGGGLSREYVR